MPSPHGMPSTAYPPPWRLCPRHSEGHAGESIPPASAGTEVCLLLSNGSMAVCAGGEALHQLSLLALRSEGWCVTQTGLPVGTTGVCGAPGCSTQSATCKCSRRGRQPGDTPADSVQLLCM